MNKRWLLYITFCFAIFVAITYAIFSYWNIGDENKWSTFFSFTSTFGILATINVYFWQKKDKDREKIEKKNSEIKLIKKLVNYAIDENIPIIHHSINNLNKTLEIIKKQDVDLNIKGNLHLLKTFELQKAFYNSMKYSDGLSGTIDNVINIIKLTNMRNETSCDILKNQEWLCRTLIDEYTKALDCLNSSKLELQRYNE
ncbi:hypothetical protein [Proteus terrae]|uniref:hypothetical protein n=1 Tax=Proteus terrae TaxID=1574161 RepID=UPI0018E838B0|nr:hypothetical protein [Proteus terrae]MBJ2110750.1 hypothetical protein [Proteus terrae]MBJ2134345.1 hypothetical protein [Proteus terrae]